MQAVLIVTALHRRSACVLWRSRPPWVCCSSTLAATTAATAFAASRSIFSRPRRSSSVLSTSNMSSHHSSEDITYLDASTAAEIDKELFSEQQGFSIDQLMELAGLSSACAIQATYPPSSHPSALVVVGPGNNGGDGLVAARHLRHFGYDVSILLPKQPSKDMYKRLLTQSQRMQAAVLPSLPADLSSFSLIVDAVFGFSFDPKDGIREPYKAVLDSLASLPAASSSSSSSPALVSIDIPSGWHVERGDESGRGLRPDMLVSLTAPKLCARGFEGSHHMLGGRFVPPDIASKYRLRLPQYEGRELFIRLPAGAAKEKGKGQGKAGAESGSGKSSSL